MATLRETERLMWSIRSITLVRSPRMRSCAAKNTESRRAWEVWRCFRGSRWLTRRWRSPSHHQQPQTQVLMLSVKLRSDFTSSHLISSHLIPSHPILTSNRSPLYRTYPTHWQTPCAEKVDQTHILPMSSSSSSSSLRERETDKL